jgi:hypothetical protein
MRKVDLNKIKDEAARKAFESLNEDVIGNPLLKGAWKRFEITVNSAVTNYQYRHNLGFQPTEVMITFQSIPGVTFDHSKFTKEYIEITTTGAATIKGFLGRYADSSIN